MFLVCLRTCTKGLVEVSRGGSVPALVELSSQLVVGRLFIIQHLQRLNTTQHTDTHTYTLSALTTHTADPQMITPLVLICCF